MKYVVSDIWIADTDERAILFYDDEKNVCYWKKGIKTIK